MPFGTRKLSATSKTLTDFVDKLPFNFRGLKETNENTLNNKNNNWPDS